MCQNLMFSFRNLNWLAFIKILKKFDKVSELEASKLMLKLVFNYMCINKTKKKHFYVVFRSLKNKFFPSISKWLRVPISIAQTR